MSVVYEWWAEETDKHGDVLSIEFYETRKDAEQHSPISLTRKVRVTLVRTVFNNADPNDLRDRQFAYVANGTLAAQFNGGAAVPKRFL